MKRKFVVATGNDKTCLSEQLETFTVAAKPLKNVSLGTQLRDTIVVFQEQL